MLITYLRDEEIPLERLNERRQIICFYQRIWKAPSDDERSSFMAALMSISVADLIGSLVEPHFTIDLTTLIRQACWTSTVCTIYFGGGYQRG